MAKRKTTTVAAKKAVNPAPATAANTKAKKTKTAARNKTGRDKEFQYLDTFMRQNRKLDLQTVNLLSPQQTEALNWKGLESRKEETLQQLKACQRLLRVLPQQDLKRVKALLKAGLHSALQIASIPRQKFLATYSAAFGNDKALAEAAYQQALAIRSRLLIRHIGRLQQAEAHAKAARLNTVKS